MSRFLKLIRHRWDRYLWVELRRDERCIPRYRSRIRELQRHDGPENDKLIASYGRLILMAMHAVDRRRASLGLDRRTA